jgi:hypothetical protein
MVKSPPQKRRRGRTLPGRRLSRRDLEELESIERVEALVLLRASRPRARGDCEKGPRPCPWVSCKYHLYLDVNPNTGAVKVNFPHLEVWQLEETCALDVADRGGIPMEEVGEAINLLTSRISQMETLAKLRAAGMEISLDEYNDPEEPPPWRR